MDREKIKLLSCKMVRMVCRILFFVFPLKEQVFFSSFSGKCYADNPKYISEKLHQIYPEYGQVWVQYKGYDFETPDYVKVVKWGSLKMLYEMTTSKVWVNSHLIRLWMPKKRGQYYIETWHGGLGFKKIEGDVADELSGFDIETGKYNSKMADLMVSNSAFLSDIYRRAFWGYVGEILEVGYPKAEPFFGDTSAYSKKVKDYFHISDNVHILLYAPTFRNETDIDIFAFDYMGVVQALEEHTREEWCFALRLHPLLSKYSSKLMVNAPNFYDASGYDDMQELTMAADVFLTDYSSGIFDFALMDRIGMLYAPDLDEYAENRGLYFDLYDLPFPVAQTEEEIVDIIDNFNYDRYLKELHEFYNSMGFIRGTDSSKLICDRIHEVMGK